MPSKFGRSLFALMTFPFPFYCAPVLPLLAISSSTILKLLGVPTPSQGSATYNQKAKFSLKPKIIEL